LRLALQEALDLVEVDAKADPPICRLLDFGRYKSEVGVP
jgi:translation initiation factor IF-3